MDVNDFLDPGVNPAFDQPAGPICAFCHQSGVQVGMLVESRTEGVYVCYACAQLAMTIIEEESKRPGLPPPER